ncbi:MAG TPA: DUF4255 domain-containing protein [Bryobacteraceae bacterium]
MPDFTAIFSVGNSLAQYLQNNYPQNLNKDFPCKFQLVSSAEIAGEEKTALDKTLSIFLHRVTTNENFRAATRIQDVPDREPVLFLDLHYLLTYWGTDVQAEHTILGWAMTQLQSIPMLDSSLLSAGAGWNVDDSIQLVPADLSLEDILRIWDALGPKYRLSVCYLARVVRIDRALQPESLVQATRFTYVDGGAAQ